MQRYIELLPGESITLADQTVITALVADRAPTSNLESSCAETNESILSRVRRCLQQARGKWGKVSQGSGVPYHTLTKIAQGKVANPRIQTIQLLVDYFASEELKADNFSDAQAAIETTEGEAAHA